MRIVVFGPPPTSAWLDALRASLPSSAKIAPFDAIRPDAALRLAAAAHPDADLILLRSGTALPPFWFERLTRALALPGVLVASPLDNADPLRAPLPPGARSDADPLAIDALCYSCGRREAIDWRGVSPLVSLWRGRALRELDPAADIDALPEQSGSWRGVLLTDLYVADPQRILRGPKPDVLGTDPSPPSPLGELRETVFAALSGNVDKSTLSHFRPGLDGKPVVLHILHGWGGGAERFVRDLASADAARHHLVLIARGNFPRRTYGETLELRDAAQSLTPLRRAALPRPIRDTALSESVYAEFLAGVLRDFGVGAIVVSSLIGHSLDALRTTLPTLLVGHDYYPLWPLLHRDFGDPRLAFDAAQLATDLARAGSDFEFADRDPAHWSALRRAYVRAVLDANATIAAPSPSMLANLLRIEPAFSALRSRVIAHGLASWPNVPAPIEPPPRVRLRLVVPGRVRRGKGADLLRAVLPRLRESADVFLLGAGAEGEMFFGEANVHIVLNYRREELPELLARIAPDAALLLPTVAETFSYTLSELASLGVPVIATRIGALAERIDDGVDGWLVATDAHDLPDTIAALRADPPRLAAARRALRARPQRSLAEMAAEYSDLLPVQPMPHPLPIGPAALADVTAQTRAAELGDARRSIATLQARNTAQEAELARRGEWGMDLERELRRGRGIVRARDALIAEQRATIAARTEWAQQAAERERLALAELDRLAAAHAQLQVEFEERTAWAKSLDAQIDRMLVSNSWRITAPLRVAARQARSLRMRLAFAWQRLRATIGRTRGSLARRGIAGTIRRAAQEFQRSAGPAPTPALVSAPGADFVPFEVPCAETPRVSIVIPVYNKIDYTVACLRSLAEHAGTVAFETIVVDDGSSDATPQRLAQITGVRTLRNERNLGFIGTCNAGAAVARGEFVLFLNNDTVVTVGWLEALLRCFEEEPDAGLVGAKLVYPDGRLQEAGGIVFADGSGWNYGRFDDPADPRYGFRREADYVSGAAIMLRTTLFRELGG
ncbi:MAG TPA: glycosyltransferase, partial [Rudaea sp.]